MHIKKQIIIAALQVLQDGEKISFSMRDVAMCAGKAPQEIYRHFRDKQALSDALVGEARKILTNYQLKALDASTPFERMLNMGQQYINFAIKHPQLYQLLFVRPVRGSTPHYPSEMGPELDLPFQMIVDRINECMQNGDLRMGKAEHIALIAWSQAHGLCMLHLSGRFTGPELKQYAALSFAQLLRGVGGDNTAQWHNFMKKHT